MRLFDLRSRIFEIKSGIVLLKCKDYFSFVFDRECSIHSSMLVDSTWYR